MKEKIFNIGKTLLCAAAIGLCMMTFFAAAVITTVQLGGYCFRNQLNTAVQEGYAFYIDGVETAPQNIPEGSCSMNNTVIKTKDREVHTTAILKEWHKGMEYDTVYIDGEKVDRNHISPELYPAEQIKYDAKTKTIYITTA